MRASLVIFSVLFFGIYATANYDELELEAVPRGSTINIVLQGIFILKIQTYIRRS